jgi:Tfp pilus assembly protein PilX
MTPDDDLIRRRQRGRALIMALLLGGLAILVFFITLTRIQQGIPQNRGASGVAAPKVQP